MRRMHFGLWALLGMLAFADRAQAVNTSDYPRTHNVEWAAVQLQQFNGICGHIGVDLIFSHQTYGDYNPCHHSDDPYYGSCVMSSNGPISYYKVFGFDNYPYGIFIDNQNPNYCTGQSWCQSGTTFVHYWAQRLGSVALEFYPYTNCNGGGYDPYTSQYGGARLYVNEWPVLANGGMYSANLGSVTLPQRGSAGVLNGFMTDNGAPVAYHAAWINAFQMGSTAQTSMGYPVGGFASVGNNADGYYTTGPVYPGDYRLYVGIGSHEIIQYLSIRVDGERMDYQMEKGYWACYGRPPCQFYASQIALKTYDGLHYVSAVGGQTNAVTATKTDTTSSSTKFFLIDLGDNRVALMTSNGYFLQALHGGDNIIKANATAVKEWETFTYIDRGNGTFALKAYNGQYVRALSGGGGLLDAKGGAIRQWETFKRVDFGTNLATAVF
jgi:hypothetical protein